MEAALFFAGKPCEASLYEALLERMRAALPPFDCDVQRTQITFRAPRAFACVSMRHKGCILVTFGLPSRVASPRIWQAAQPHPNRWTHHVKICRADEADEELLGWLQAAYAFAGRK